MIPRDRWVGASPELNVTPGGKALEALSALLELAKQRAVTYSDIERAIETVNLEREQSE